MLRHHAGGGLELPLTLRSSADEVIKCSPRLPGLGAVCRRSSSPTGAPKPNAARSCGGTFRQECSMLNGIDNISTDQYFWTRG